MSTLTDQIKAKCTTIAQNTKKIYDKGFAEGRASVKHITFSVEGQGYCALSGMTLREWASSDMSYGEFRLEGDALYHYNNLVACNVDDEIIDQNYYWEVYTFYLFYNSQNYSLYHYDSMSWYGWVDSEYNTIGLYFDDDGYLRTPTGEYIYIDDAYTDWIVDRDSYIEWNNYKADSEFHP